MKFQDLRLADEAVAGFAIGCPRLILPMVAKRGARGEDYRMLIPRFSLRWLLAATTICGLLAYVVAQAVRGEAWGIAVSVVGGAVIMTAVVFAMVFIVAWSIAAMAMRARKSRATSPFATHVAPPQILPPIDPE